MTVTAVIFTHNSERLIKPLLDSLSFCHAINIIDDYSSDWTEAIAKENQHVHFYRHGLKDDYAAHHNFAGQTVTTDYALFIDDDEQVTPELAKEIIKKINNRSSKISGY